VQHVGVNEAPSRPPALRIDITPRTLAMVLITIAAIWIAFALTNVLVVLVVALILVGTIEPIVGFLEERRLGRGKALALIFILLTLAFAGCWCSRCLRSSRSSSS
jgi:predicted PurR-regulated permease PerM